jgi:membrane-bound lytic murein transglycosylase D
MLKFLLLLLLPILLIANLTYTSNHNEELSVLDSFDIESSFLYDPIMNGMKNEQSSLNKNKEFFQAMEDGYLFIPAVKSILSENDIPQAFLYLAMAESNFYNKAYSVKKASGLWQFMPITAKGYHLKIDEYVDERRDLVKSTKAASKYLSSLHKQFGKWYLAAIAYNCGGGKLNNAIEQAGSDELSVLLDENKKYLPKESRDYVRRIVALALMGNNEQFMLKSEYEYLLNRANAYSISTVKLPMGESLSRVANLIGIPLEELKKLNRHLKYDFMPPYSDGYDIYIPYIKLSEFKQKYYEEPIENIYKVHLVAHGDSLSAIGKKYGVTFGAIKDFNSLKSNKLALNQKLIIPIRIADNKLSDNKKIDSIYYYMVKNGDSLQSISKEYKISVQNIKIHNNLENDTLKVGDKLRMYE